MFSRKLIAMAVAGALCSTGAFAEMSTHNGSQDAVHTTPLTWDDEFDGLAAVGGTEGAGGSGSGGFSSAASGSQGDVMSEEVYLIPAPLAQFDGERYLKAQVRSAQEIDRLATENVYVAIPIDDAIVDPVAAITSGPDAFANLSDATAWEGDESSAG